jgi:hypothetical protein
MPILLLATMAGCVSGKHALTPEGLATSAGHETAADAHPTDCPDVSGTYTNSGRLADDTPPEICQTSSPNYEWTMDWLCDARLSANLGYKASTPSIVRIEQPDTGTIRVYPGAMENAGIVLHRKDGDFECKAGVLTIGESGVDRVEWGDSSTGEETGFQRNFSRFQSALGILVFSGGYKSLRREFSKDRDGALVMRITRSAKGIWTAVPVIRTYSTFVTWPPATSE